MLSHPHKCLFTEVPKTASTSIRALLGHPPKPHLDLLQIRDLYRAELRPKHGDARSRAIAEEAFATYYKFGFVRNPWDRTVSLYHRVEAADANTISFEAFVDWIQFASDNCLHPTPHRHQLDWFRDEKGEIVADFIGRFETLDADWANIRTHLGLTADLPHVNANPLRDRRHYSDYYTPETRALIAQKFALDIDHFSYEFEDTGYGRISSSPGSPAKAATPLPADLALTPGTRWDPAWFGDPAPRLDRGAQLLVFLDPATLVDPKWTPFLNRIHRAPALPRVFGILPSSAETSTEDSNHEFPLAHLDDDRLAALVPSLPTALLLQDGLQTGPTHHTIPPDLMKIVRTLYRHEVRHGPPKNTPTTTAPTAPTTPYPNPSETVPRPAPLIERVPSLSAQDFWENYFAHDRPVIMTAMTGDWPAAKNWTPQHLSDRFGEVEVEIQAARSTDPDYELRIDAHRKSVLFKDYINDVLHGGPTNDYYMVANNRNLEQEALQGLTDDVDLGYFRDDEPLEGRCFLWFGPGGTITPLHKDVVPVLFAQLQGRKRWRLIHPDHAKFLYNDRSVFSEVDAENPDYQTHPLYAQAITTEIVLEPGELLFLPQGWWHQVKSLDVSISLSYSLRPPTESGDDAGAYGS